jgi:hypothetical protein
MSYALVDDSSERGSRVQIGNGAADDHDASGSGRRSSTAGMDSKSSLSQPLALNGDEEAGDNSADPFYVFRADLYRKLEQVDESLAEYLRIVHQTVRI